MADSSKKLNSEQNKAVKHGSGPLLIVAGAGTGKTTVITERVKYLILEKNISPKNILALTFTEKASYEMVDRIDQALPFGYSQMWVSTFHAFCDAILRAESLHIGLDPKFKLLTTVDGINFLRKNIFGFDLDYFRPLGNPTKFVSAIQQHISRLQDENITPLDYLAWVKKRKFDQDSPEEVLDHQKWTELANVYAKYDELKIKNSYLDYGDLITKTLELFKSRPNVLKKYQQQFEFVLVDEFQDTNIAQYDLIKLLAPSKLAANITVVGDDSQSIYKFRGAAVSNIMQFKSDYKNAQTIVLTKNYRSTQTILDASYKLIKHNDPDTLEAKLGITKNLVSQVNYPKTDIVFFHTPRIENEADEVVNEIVKLVNEGFEYKDIAILVRANNHAEAFIQALNYQGIPNQFLGPGKLFKQPEIIDLIAYLKVVFDPADWLAGYRLLSSDLVNISGQDLATISSYAKKYNRTLVQVCKQIAKLDVSKQTKEKITKLAEILVKHFEQAKRESAGKVLYNFLEEFDLLSILLNPEDEKAQMKAENIAAFFQKLKGFEVDNSEASIPAVVDWIDLASDLGESPLSVDSDWTSQNAVNILTVHGAKGLEFPVVFLVNLVAQRFPTNERKEALPIPDELIKEVLPQGDYHLQEERRLFYVGMTRAKQRLYFTASDYYGEGKRTKKLSEFIFEALGSKAIDVTKIQKKHLTLPSFNQSEVKHQKPKLEVNYLSYSQIETFKICPLHYKLNYIIKLPLPPSASQSFGISIHAALKHFYDLVKMGEKPNEALIHKCLKENWINQGYLTNAHEKKFFEKGKLYLSGYLTQGFDKNRLPVLMEEKFTLPIGSTKPLKVGGVIDRIDKLSDTTIEIIDYKTGASIPSQKEVDANMQLSFYALAATHISHEPFGKLPENVKLSLYFFDTQEKLTTTRTQADLLKAKEEILKVRDDIENSDFNCSKGFLCQNCEFKMFCTSIT